MSKLSDYSKFDHLDESASDEGEQDSAIKNATNVPLTTTTQAGVMRKNDENGRYVFEYGGKPIYEWEQNLEDVIIYAKPPPGVSRGKQIRCEISHNHLKLGLQGGSQWFLNEPLGGIVEVSESTWGLEDDDSGEKEICIYLTKAHKGDQWNTALAGRHSASLLDPVAQEEVRKDMMLERFQQENPGFDFRGAEFNGQVPDPREYMGGIKYS